VIIAGVDEAGRGALAGPVVAACVVFPLGFTSSLVCDSKQLTSRQRQLAYDVIMSSCCVGISSISARKIDHINVLNATLLAMVLSVKKLGVRPDLVKVDGHISPQYQSLTFESIVKGDQRVKEISAASIVAKVTRDSIMSRCHQRLPEYGFDSHKGYGTKDHYDAIFSYGVSFLHRKSFNLNRQLSFI
jgi:ribonuclease HII